ncbi:MAG: hypothetical protein HQL79_07930 [Magnetococcales bacterium]|nr:hypothetical protein [Magnetococcales bacterium]
MNDDPAIAEEKTPAEPELGATPHLDWAEDEMEAAGSRLTQQDKEPFAGQKGYPRSAKGEKRIVGIRLLESCMVYRVVANFPDLIPGDPLLVQTRDGETTGRVIFVSGSAYTGKNDSRSLYPGRITRIVRKLGAEEETKANELREKELQAKILGRELIRQEGLPMKLSRVVYQPSGTKAIFTFTSEARVDFRELVKQLTEKLNVRIEMRHIGVRDETQMLGGVGNCGKDFCCAQFLKKFHPVSVRMAKNQDLSLNPEGISGVCGRLMCCLAYENDTYTHLRESLPTLKGHYWTRDGRAVQIRTVHPLQGSVVCQLADGTREYCPASSLLAEKPDVAVPETAQHIEEKTSHKPDVVTSGVATAQGGAGLQAEDTSASGEKKRRSRKRKNRKKSDMSGDQAGVAADRSNAPPVTGGDGEVGPSAEPENREEAVAEEKNTPGGTSVRKKRRRKKKKPSSAVHQSPEPPVTASE